MSAGRAAPFAAVVVACLLAACSPDLADLARQRALDELDDHVEKLALEDLELINKAETMAVAEQALRARQGVIGVALDGSTVTWAGVLTARGDASSWPARYSTAILRACVEVSADVSSVPSRRLDWAPPGVADEVPTCGCSLDTDLSDLMSVAANGPRVVHDGPLQLRTVLTQERVDGLLLSGVLRVELGGLGVNVP